MKDALFSNIQIYFHSHITFHSLIDMDIELLTLQVNPLSTAPETQTRRNKALLHGSSNNSGSITEQ